MKGKVAVITGGNGTLGSAFAKGLAQAGATVYILGRNASKSRKKVNEFKKMGLTIHSTACDVLDKKSVQSAAKRILKKAGKVDILINGAGGNISGATVMPDQSIFDISINQFRKVTDLNLLGTVISTIVFAKTMVKEGKGSIINISSMSAQLPLTRVVGYSAAKAAVDNLHGGWQ